MKEICTAWIPNADVPYRVIYVRVPGNEWPSSCSGSANICMCQGCWSSLRNLNGICSTILTSALPKQNMRLFRNPNNPRKEHPVHCGYCISWSSQQDIMEKLHPTYKICLDCFSSKIYTGHPFSSWWFPITDSSFWVQHFIESKIVQSPAFTPSHYLHPWCVCVRGASYYTIRRILYSDNCWTYRSVHSFLSGNGDWLWSLE